MTSHEERFTHEARGRPRVLVADDDVVMRRLMVEALKRAAFDVVEASDGEQALNVVKVGAFDAVVIDVMMPSTNGLQATHLLRAKPNGETLPIIMVSGSDDPSLLAQAFSLGADDFITKPIVPSELVTRVRGVLRPGTGVADRANVSSATDIASWPPPGAPVSEATRRCPWPAPAVSPTEPTFTPATRLDLILRFARSNLELGQSELRA